jgi:NAD dependent epimerase/dehydratase family enzyme
MKEFARGLGKALHRPSWAPVPAAPLKILLGEFALVLLEGQRAVPKKLIDTGFKFRFPDLEAALGDLL